MVLDRDSIESYLSSANPMERVRAARHAQNYGKEFENSLISCLEDEYYEVRSNAALSLGKIGSQQAVPRLNKLLFDEVEEVRYHVAKALGMIGDTSSIPFLIQALKDPSREARRQIAQALSKFSPDEVGTHVFTYINGIATDDWLQETQESIEKIDTLHGILEASFDLDGNWIEELARFGLDCPDIEAKRLAARLIGRKGYAQFVDKLMEYIDHEDHDLRHACVYSLTLFEFPDKVALLSRFVDDEYEFVRQAIVPVLKDKTLLQQLANDPEAVVRLEVAKYCDSLNILESLSTDPSHFVRQAVVKRLSELASPHAIALIHKISTTETDELVLITIDNVLEQLKHQNDEISQ